MRALVVDDQRSARRILVKILAHFEDLEIFEADSLVEARRILGENQQRSPIDVALIDIRLDSDARNHDGLILVAEIREHTTTVPIVVTAYSEMAEIRAAMRLGAYDYIFKDDLCEELVVPVIQGLRSRRQLEREVLELRARGAGDRGLSELVGTSQPMRMLHEVIKKVALSDRPVLVTGPTGSGKELVVRAIHGLGAHPDQPLLDLNCGAIPEALVESMLFGHEEGAFTGAVRRHEGYLSTVRTGTLFLDEIAELAPLLQSKLLRALETRRFRPIGSTVERRFEGRVVAATHANLEARVTEGRFREDLLYRLNVLHVRVPSLDERREDIPALVAYFAGQEFRPLRFDAEALNAFSRASWPGNVRQLRNLIDRIAVFADQEIITAEILSSFTYREGVSVVTEGSLPAIARTILQLPVDDKLAAIEDALIAEAMTLVQGNKTAAARLLGVHRKVIERRLEKQDVPCVEPPAQK